MSEQTDLYQQWLDAKNKEIAAVEERRKIEDELSKLLNVPEEYAQSQIWENEGFKIKLTGRINTTINAQTVREIASEQGLEDVVDTLFRWKAEINKKAWDSSDEKITSAFTPAITTKPSRVTFSIEKIEEN